MMDHSNSPAIAGYEEQAWEIVAPTTPDRDTTVKTHVLFAGRRFTLCGRDAQRWLRIRNLVIDDQDMCGTCARALRARDR